MSPATESFQRALRLHQSGQLDGAQAGYREALRLQPKYPAALHLLGVIAAQTGNPSEALSLIGRAIELDPRDASMHFHLAKTLHGMRQLDAALRGFCRAIELKPDFAHAYCDRGILLCELDRRGEALEDYDKAISIKPDLAEAYSNRGDLLRELGRLDEALASCEHAIMLRENFAEAHCNRGVVQRELGRWGAALESFDRALAIRNDYAEAYCNRGIVLKELHQFQAALANYDRAIAIAPEYAEAHCFRGNLLRMMNRLSEALASCDRAISLRENYAEAHSSRGSVLKELNQLQAALASFDRAIRIDAACAEAHLNRGAVLSQSNELDAAIASYDKAIEIDADLAQAHVNRSMALLLKGNYDEGWRAYEWRKRVPTQDGDANRRRFSRPLWLGGKTLAGETLAGKTLLLHCEQGLGDTIQFCRYVKLVADLGARVILEVQAPLKSLLGGLAGVSQLVAQGEALPDFDGHCPLLSLPLAFNTTLSTVPADVPYLHADAERRLLWQRKLGAKRQLRVGLVWSGGLRADQPELWSVNSRRNIPLAKLASLEHPEIEFYSLQKGQPAEAELARLMSDGRKHIIDNTCDLLDFSDTAALIDQLDLVISVDTSTAHLAGAMGKPVWILNRHDTCWRWLLERADSPWYPTATIYRQKTAGDWDAVMSQVRKDLIRLMG